MKTLKTGRIFDPINAFKVQTITFSEAPTNADTISFTYEGMNDVATVATDLTTRTTQNNIIASITAATASNIGVGFRLSNITSTGFVITFYGADQSLTPPSETYGYLLTDVDSGTWTVVTTIESIIYATDKNETLVQFVNGTDKALRVDYYGSFDGSNWQYLGSAHTSNAKAVEIGTSDRDTLTEPWPKLKIVGIPVTGDPSGLPALIGIADNTPVEITIDAEAVITAYWGANG